MCRIILDNNLAYFRSKAGLPQAVLARLCGVSKNCISAIERGCWYPSLKLALKLSFILMVSVHDIFWISDSSDDEWQYLDVD